MKRILLLIFKIAVYLLMIFFVMLVIVFFAIRFGWTNVAGEEDLKSSEYNSIAEENLSIEIDVDAIIIEKLASTSSSSSFSLPENESIYGPREKEIWCKIDALKEFNDYHAKLILDTFLSTRSETLFNNMLLAAKIRLNNLELDEQFKKCTEAPKTIFLSSLKNDLITSHDSNIFAWQKGEPWQIIREAIIKDLATINLVSSQAGIQPRLLVSVAIVEQLRLYYTQRELFEKVFKPLKVLANANKMAWGIMAIKEKTAIDTENHLKDVNSPFYLGEAYSGLLDINISTSSDKNKERYQRLTDEKDHYYSYLYGALIIRQLENQWEKAGYAIRYRPELVATLFNIGFKNSIPKEDPKVGGSTIEIESEKYFFGSLAYEFYYSGEMAEYFLYK